MEALPVTDSQQNGYSSHAVRLAWILAVAYLLVIAYASLLPFRGWRVPPDEILHFLIASWPRFITLQDVIVNVVAYVPLGLLLSVGWGTRHGPARGAAAATLAVLALSLAMELAQMFLPVRIASNVDLIANGIGGLIGAMAAPLLAPTRALGGRLHAARHRVFHDGMLADVGLVIVALWLLTQFHPTAQLFGSGALRATLDMPALFAHTPALAFSSEAAVVLLNLLGVGLMLLALMHRAARPLRVVGVVVATALAIKLFNAVALVQATAPFAWLTPGVVAGLVAGWLLLYAASRLPRIAQLAVAACCIALATVAINLAPDNPYHSVPPRLLARGASHFLSFSGIARALSELWPLLAIGYLACALARRDRGETRNPI
jgi:VanZ family protein